MNHDHPSSKTASFRRRLLAGDPLIGTWVKTPSSIVCEVLGATDLDTVCLDAEHAPFDRLQLDGCLSVLRPADMPALVRVPSAAPEAILNALDCGATGVVVPHVKSVASAEAVARAARYGAGGRGYAGSSRASGYGAVPMADYLAQAAAETTVIAQIEDLDAMDVLDEIAAVDGIDSLFIGRIDLTVAMGAASPADPAVLDIVETICAAGRRAGRAVGMFVPDIAEVPRWRDAGATLFLLGSDQGFLKAGAQNLVAQACF